MTEASNQQPDTPQICKHRRTQLIAKDNQAEYIECLDCGAILETGEMDAPKAAEPEKIDESLSDA